MYKQILPIITFAKIDIRRLFRDRVAIFFTVIFPLIFLFVFGGLFGRDQNVSFKVALVNESSSPIAAQLIKQSTSSKLLKVDSEATSLEGAREKMLRGELDATIVLPASFGEPAPTGMPSGQATVYYDANSQQAGAALTSVLQTLFKDINKQFVPIEEPFTVASKSTGQAGLRQFDYVFAGLLGFSIMSLGIFGPTSVFPRLKQKGVLRRYHTTSLKVWQYFMGNVLSNVFVGILSVTTMFITALLVFNLTMRGDYLSLLALVVLGTVTLFGIGLAVGGWAKNENQAAPLANLISFPMMFLSGTFFPRFLMPEWLQTLTTYLPLTPVIDGARLIITEGKTVLDILPQMGLLVAWAILIYAIAFRVFRWE